MEQGIIDAMTFDYKKLALNKATWLIDGSTSLQRQQRPLAPKFIETQLVYQLWIFS